MSVFWGVGMRSGMVCVACVISHVSISRSGVCPSIWHLYISDKPEAAVALGWNPMGSSWTEAFGSRRVSLWLRRPVPGNPACMRNAGEFRWPIIVGIAIFAVGGGGV